jgi:hypothetical protein
MTTAERTDPDLWEEVKDELMASDKGGEPGEWSARKAQLAVQAYKRRGGGYADDGPDQDDTDLHAWTEEDWGTRSGDPSSETGQRYLPREVRMVLTSDEYARSTQRKIDGEEQFVDQPDDVARKAARIRKKGPTKEMLVERARDLDIEGRSTMDKAELLEAIDDTTDANGRGKGTAASLQARTKDELYEMARDRDLDGRSTMDKDALVQALVEKDPS